MLVNCKNITYRNTFKEQFYKHITIIRCFVTRTKTIEGKYIVVRDFNKSLIYIISITNIGAQVRERGHFYLYDNVDDMEQDVKKWEVWFKEKGHKINRKTIDSLLLY
jgi:hypothetical protein